MRVAVMGSGAVGGYFGGRLAMAGHDVCFIARGEHLRAIRQTGLQVESTKGDFLVFPAEVNDDPAKVGAVELAIVSVKSWQLSEAARQMRPLVGPETIVLPLLNGVEAADELAKALPPAQILGGLCRIIAHVEAPGRIRHSGMEPSLVFGELDSRLSERVKSLKVALDRAGIQAEIASDFRAALWRKFMLISTWAGSPRSPVHRLESGAVSPERGPWPRPPCKRHLRSLGRVGLHGGNIPLRRGPWCDELGTAVVDAATRLRRAEHMRGDRRPPRGHVSLRFEPGSRQYRDLLRRPEKRPPDGGWVGVHTGRGSSLFRTRSDRDLPVCVQPE